MRRNTDFSRYSRALAFNVPRGALPKGDTVLTALSVNEAQLIYLLVKWSECCEEKASD